VEFAEHRDAQLALAAMNKRVVLGRVCQLSRSYTDVVSVDRKLRELTRSQEVGELCRWPGKNYMYHMGSVTVVLYISNEYK